MHAAGAMQALGSAAHAGNIKTHKVTQHDEESSRPDCSKVLAFGASSEDCDAAQEMTG
jgi:hypothetical protein